MSTKQNFDIQYDIQDITANTKIFVGKLDALACLREDNKVGIHEDKLYIEVVKHKALQMWVRKWYNQTRQDINKYLEKELASYSIFLDMVYAAREQLNHKFDYNNNLGINKKLVKGIVIGLGHIKNVYNSEYQPIETTCEKYIKEFDTKIKRFDW